MARSSFVSWLVALLWSLSMAIVVHAQTPQQTQLVDQGLALREQGRDEEALRVFELALEHGRDARVLAQVAFAEQALGRWVAASQHLQEALAQTSHPWLTDKRDLLAAELAKIEAHLARIEVKINVEGATITINGNAVGTAPLTAPVVVEHGTVVVGARAEGHFEATRQLTLEPGSVARLELDLTPVPAETATSGGTTGDVAQQTTVHHVVERAPSGPTRNPVWLLVAAGGLAVSGASVATWLIAEGRVADLREDCADRNGCDTDVYEEKRSAIEQLDTLTNVLWISGTVIAAGGVAAYFVWTTREDDESTPRDATQVSIAPFGMGAMTQVRF